MTLFGQSVQAVNPRALNVAPTVVGSATNVSISGGVITFNFVGRFADVNDKQTFQVAYKNSAGQDATQDFTFNKIRSLTLLGNGDQQDCSVIRPTPATITAPRCQSGSVNVSFPNISYINPVENPVLCYGTVSSYEYLLPTGWQLGTTTSNGSTWIASGNNATITYNNTAGGVVRIRPLNSACGANLNRGREVQIPVSRPRPSLSISGNDVLCSGTANYSIAGTLPPGATVCWTISSPTGAATIPSSPYCGTTLPVTFNSAGRATITATVTDCIESYTLSQKDIVIGTPAVDRFFVDGDRFDYNVNGPNRNYTVCPSEGLNIFPNIPVGTQGVIGVLEHSWEYVSGTYQIFQGGNYYGAYVYTSSNVGAQLELRYRYRNACGWSGYDNVYFTNMNCDGGEEPYRVVDSGFDFTVSPNPAKNIVIVSTTGVTTDFEVRIFDMVTSKLVKVIRFRKGQKQATLQIADLNAGAYIVQVTAAGKTKSKQLRVVK